LQKSLEGDSFAGVEIFGQYLTEESFILYMISSWREER
jgi:hypothetical protein